MASNDWADDFVRRVEHSIASADSFSERCEVRKELAAELRARLGGWQPIATAPKDGTPILVVCVGNHPDTGKPFVPTVATWDRRWITCEGCDYDCEEWDTSFDPDFWMPLPATPAEGGGT